jgi:hypothetical protein
MRTVKECPASGQTCTLRGRFILRDVILGTRSLPGYNRQRIVHEGDTLTIPTRPFSFSESSWDHTMAFKKAELISTHKFTLAGLLYRDRHLFLVGTIFGAIALGFVIVGAVKKNTDMFLFGLIPLVIGLGFFIETIHGFLTRPGEMKVYLSGLSWRDIRGSFAYQWEDLDSVFRYEWVLREVGGAEVNRVSRLSLVFSDGVRVVLDECLRKYTKLAEMIQSHAAIVMLPVLREEWREGAADFGPIVLRHKGIDIWKKRYSWENVKSIRVDNGHLVVRTRPGKQKHILPLAKIPNYLILLKLLAETDGPN